MNAAFSRRKQKEEVKKRINKKERERKSVVQRRNNAQCWYSHLTSVTACTSSQRAHHDLSASKSINNVYSANHDIRVQACISQVHPCCRMIPKSKLTTSQCQRALFSNFFSPSFIAVTYVLPWIATDSLALLNHTCLRIIYWTQMQMCYAFITRVL